MIETCGCQHHIISLPNIRNYITAYVYTKLEFLGRLELLITLQLIVGSGIYSTLLKAIGVLGCALPLIHCTSAF